MNTKFGLFIEPNLCWVLSSWETFFGTFFLPQFGPFKNCWRWSCVLVEATYTHHSTDVIATTHTSRNTHQGTPITKYPSWITHHGTPITECSSQNTHHRMPITKQPSWIHFSHIFFISMNDHWLSFLCININEIARLSLHSCKLNFCLSYYQQKFSLKFEVLGTAAQ